MKKKCVAGDRDSPIDAPECRCYAECISGISTLAFGGDYMILVDSQDASPIYEQVYRRIRTLIMTEALKEGEQLPSVRSLAMELSINPNTIQRAYSLLEQEKLVYVVKGRGNFVAHNDEIPTMKRKQFIEKCQKIIREARQMEERGLTGEEITEMLRQCMEEENDRD